MPPIDRREYLQYTGAFAGGTALVGQRAGATADGSGDAALEAGAASPAKLRVEYEREPNNLLPTPADADTADDASTGPRFTWEIEGPRGVEQSAYRLQVAADPAAFEADQGGTWDTGRVESSRSTTIPYEGDALAPDTTYHWRVRIWDAGGAASAWSEPATFTTAIPDAAEHWEGEWIRPLEVDLAGELTSPLLRTDADLSEAVESARAHVLTLGYGELYANGERVGDHQLDPAWTEYGDRVRYSTYDVGDLLEEGANAVGLWLGRGWFSKGAGEWQAYGPPQALLQLNVTYTDGSTDAIITDGSWTASPSPIRENDIYDGETYDALLEQPGWAEPDFEALGWVQAAEVEPPGDEGAVVPQRTDPIRVTDTFEPVAIAERNDGYMVDFGQTLAGWVELTVRGANAGDEIVLEHAEVLLDQDGELTRDVESGSLNQDDLRNADATDTYVARGDDVEVYEPRFTYHGFRYAKIQGYPGELSSDDIVSKAVHTDFRERGQFACSEADLNQVQHNAKWGLRSNFHSIPTDCPQRDERMGWTGDAHPTAVATLYNFDAVRFYEKFLADHDDNQGEDGTQTDTIPHAFGGRPSDPNWAKTQATIPWHVYLHTGDERVLEENFDNMRAYVDYWHEEEAEDGIVPWVRYGDWLAFESTMGPLLGTFAHYQTTEMVAKAAAELGREDAATYRQRTDAIADAFNDAFLGRSPEHFDGGTIDDGSLVVHGGGVVLHDTSEDADEWGDYTLEAGFTLEQDAAGFVFRASDANDLYMWQINTVAQPYPTLRPHVRVGGQWTVLDEVDISDAFEGEGVSHRIEIVAEGEEITTAIDGTQVDTRTDGTHASGTVGFRQHGEERVRVHSVGVIDPGGATLFSDDFTGTGDLVYGNGTQTALALPLFAGIVPEEYRPAVVESLARKVREDGGKLQTGFVGTRALLFALVEHGHEALAYRVVSQPEVPGWVYMARNGATTHWERWDSDQQVGSGMNSFNHLPWNLVTEWFYRALAGIEPGAPGFDHAEIAPIVPDDLEWAEGSVDTVRGEVASRWERDGDGLRLEASIPGNTTGSVAIPTLGGGPVRVREGGKTVWNDGNRARPLHEGIEDVSREGDRIVVDVSAGEYHFELEGLGAGE